MANLDILCCGELTMDEISIVEKIRDSEASEKLNSTGDFYGGRGGNVSVYSRLFSANVGIVAAVANDSEGMDYTKYLTSKKIVSSLYENKKAKTSKCFIFNSSEKTRIFFYGGAIREEHAEYLQYVKSAVSKIDCKVIFCTSPDNAINQAALATSKAQTKIYAPSSNISSHSKESILECLQNADILFLNHLESEFLENLLKKTPEEIVEEFGLELFVRTMGSKGSQAITKEGTIQIPPCKPQKVVDANGAGDAFAGAFVANYLKTKEIAYSGRIASALASFVVEQVGCQTNMPALEDVIKRAQASSN